MIDWKKRERRKQMEKRKEVAMELSNCSPVLQSQAMRLLEQRKNNREAASRRDVPKEHDGKRDRYKDYPFEETVKTNDGKVQFKEVKAGREELQGMKPLDQDILLMWMYGHSTKEIAEACGCCKGHVLSVVKSDRFRAAYNEVKAEALQMVGDAQAFCQHHTMDSIRKLVWLRDNAKSEHVQRASATDILDRGGLPKVDKQERHVTTHNVNLDLMPVDYQAELLEERLKLLNEGMYRKHLEEKGGEEFEIPEIVDGEVIGGEIDWRDPEIGGNDEG